MSGPINSLAPSGNGGAPAKSSTFSGFMTGPAIKNRINEMIGGKEGPRFISSIVSAVSTNPALSECDHSSIFSAALLGESLGLSPSPQLGQYYMVPFNDRKRGCKIATFQLGYKGYIQLAIRSGQYKKLNVVAIKEGELVRYDPLFEEIEVNLIQDDSVRENTPTIGYYAMFEYLNGFRKTMFWTIEKMEAHADKYSMAFKLAEYKRLKNGEISQRDMWKFSSFWYKDFDGMAFKTMLRQIISKWGIMSIEIQQAMAGDHARILNDGTPQYIDADPLQGEASDQGQPAVEPTNQPEADQGQNVSAEDDFFEQDESQASEGATPETEETLATNALSDNAEAYIAANPAERKKILQTSLQSQKATLPDMEKLVGKGYGQWSKQDRIKLLKAYISLATGTHLSEVFPTK